MTQTAAKPQRENGAERLPVEDLDQLANHRLTREKLFANLRLLWLRRQSIFWCASVGLVCATLIAFLTPKRYLSVTQLMPPDSESSGVLSLVSGFAGQSGSLGAVAGDMLGLKSTGALFIGVMRSRTVEDGIVNNFDLKNVYGTRAEWAARQILEQNTGISEDRKSGIITLAVTDHDPKRAAAIAKAYVDELDGIITQLTTSSAHRERIFLEERLSTVKQDLESAERNFSQFASRSGAIDITAQSKATVDEAATLEGQLIAAQSEMQGLKQVYTDNNVRVRATQARIIELRRQLEKLSGATNQGPNGDQATTDSLYPSLRQLPVLGVPYADLYRRLKVEEVVFETLTKEYEVAKVEEAKEVPTVRVLDPPEIPERKSYPPRLQFMILGIFFGMGLGVTGVLAKAKWQAIAFDDPAKLLALEVFHGVRASMPWSASNGSRNGAGAAQAATEREEPDESQRK